MPISYCPRCNKQIAYAKGTEDIVHKCDSGNETLDKEDAVVVGDWEDETGSNTDTKLDGVHTKLAVANTLAGTRAGNEGSKNYEWSSRGNRKATHRVKQHEEYIKLS